MCLMDKICDSPESSRFDANMEGTKWKPELYFPFWAETETRSRNGYTGNSVKVPTGVSLCQHYILNK